MANKVKSVNEIRRELREDIKDYLRTYAQAYGHVASNEITNAAKYAIEAFYENYTPTWYKRTENLKENSYKLYYQDNGRRVYGGVRISADDMNPYYQYGNKGDIRDPWLVLETAWVGGYHGIYGDGFFHVSWERMLPTPLSIVMEAMQSKEVLNKCNEAGVMAANSKIYKHLPLKSRKK